MKRKRRRRRSGRKAGGQAGHGGQSRTLSAEVDAVQVCAIPAQCPDCGAMRVCEPRMKRYQVDELIDTPTRRTEYQVMSARCTRCRKRRRGTLPTGVSGQSVGPRLKAVMTHLTGTLGVSRRQCTKFLGEDLGVHRSRGTLSTMEAQVSTVLQPTVEAIRENIRSSPTMHRDETGHRRRGKRCTTWVASTDSAATFYVGHLDDVQTYSIAHTSHLSQKDA